MEIKSTKDNIIFLKGDSQYELTSTFWRLQEFYESPKFRNRYFNIEEYMDWYAEEFGNFTYFSDWSGFNVPGDIVRKFFGGDIPYELFEKEKNLHEILDSYIRSNEKFYVIGVYEDDNVVDHEFAHAFFHLDTDYKKQMTKLVNELPTKFRDHVFEVLKNKGYHKAVHIDETQAYLSTNTMMDSDDMFDQKIPWDAVLELQRAFHKRFEDYKDEK